MKEECEYRVYLWSGEAGTWDEIWVGTNRSESKLEYETRRLRGERVMWEERITNE